MITEQSSRAVSKTTIEVPEPKYQTFEAAVLKQLDQAKQKRKATAMANKLKRIKKITVLDIEDIMEKCIKMVEKASPTALNIIGNNINCQLRDEVKKEMTLWIDENHLNLVHYTIIYKRPEILQYLLSESCVFPEDSHPTICPYAHLAAFLGSTASLQIILKLRPGDYFKTSLPEHEIKLPSHIKKRLCLDTHSGNKIPHINDILQSINYFKQNVSRHSDNVKSDNLNDLVSHLQKISNKNFEPRKALLPPIPRTRSKNTVAHSRIVNPTAYNQLFRDKSEEAYHPLTLEKTPLTLAAERGHTDTVKCILDDLYSIGRKSVSFGRLQSATKAMSPEAITALLEAADISHDDYQNSVLEAIRQLLPDCLIALLSNKAQRSFTIKPLFGGMNLYHIMYSQFLDTDDDRHQMLPLMTQALIYCKKDVNNYTLPQTFPLYTLITCSFNVGSINRLYPVFECLQLLLRAGANIFFNEQKPKEEETNTEVHRPAYTSIFNCIFENTLRSLERHNDQEVPPVIMKSSLLFALKMINTRNKVYLEPVLFEYLENACHVGLDKHILNKMLVAGANPNKTIEGRYPLNIYFDSLFEYFLEFQRSKSHDFYKKELETLMIVCKQMERYCLRTSVKMILNQYTTRIPVEAVPITRYFFYLVDSLTKKHDF